MTGRTQSRQGAQLIRRFILDGAHEGSPPAGGKLPTERELAKRFAIPRNAVRKTLAQLEAEGAIMRHVGRGTFLVNVASAEGPAEGAASHISPGELMEARLRIEPAITELIITNATSADFDRMEMCLDKAERAATLDQFELWDAALHEAMASATHNRFVIRVIGIVTAVRQQSEWGKLKDRIVTPERRLKYQAEHRAIVSALKDRDHMRAKEAVATHLQNAWRNLFGY